MTVLALDPNGSPQEGVLVLFADASGAELPDQWTGPDGKATVEMEPGGSATVVRPSSLITNVVTYLDLWPNASIVTQAPDPPPQSTIMVSFDATMGAHYEIHTSCSSVPATFDSNVTAPVTTPVNIDARCTTVDMIVTEGSAAGSRNVVIEGRAVPLGSVVMIAASQWRASTIVPVTITGQPTNLAGGTAAAIGWMSAPRFDGSFIASNTYAPGQQVLWTLPMNIGLTAHLRLFAQNGGFGGTQIVTVLLGKDITSYSQDLSNLLMHWSGALVTDSSGAMTWPITLPAGVTAVESNLFIAAVTYLRSGMRVNWAVVGLASRITKASDVYSFMLPDLPGTRPFELVPNTNIETSTMVEMRVDPALADQVRAIVGAPSTRSLFSIPTLDDITVTLTGSM